MIDYVGLIRSWGKENPNSDEEGELEKVKSIIFWDKITRLLSMFKWNGLPSNIPSKILEVQLLTTGGTLFFREGDEYYISTGTAGGTYNYLYLPTKYIVSNPYIIPNGVFKEFEIGVDSVLVKNDTLLQGATGLTTLSADLEAHTKISARIALINLRLMSIIKASDANAKDRVDEFLKKLKEGELTAITDTWIAEELEAVKVLEYISPSYYSSLTSILEYEQYTKSSWYNAFGLNANWNAKREAIGEGESSLNSDSLKPLIDDMLYNRKMACDSINSMFGLNLSVELDSAWKDNEIELEAEQEILEKEGGKEDENKTENEGSGSAEAV